MEQFRRYGGEQCRHQLIELPESLAQPVTFTDNVITDGHSASRTATGGTARLRVCGTGRPLARTLGRDLRRAIPDVYRGYAALHEAALAPGALDTKTKELLALAIAVTRKCGGCIAAHAQGAAHNDATEAEVAEALGVAMLTIGGRRRYTARVPSPPFASSPRPSRSHSDTPTAGAAKRVRVIAGVAGW